MLVTVERYSFEDTIFFNQVNIGNRRGFLDFVRIVSKVDKDMQYESGIR